MSSGRFFSESPPIEALHARRALWPHLYMASYGVGWALAVDVGIRLYAAEIVAFAGLALINWFPLLRRYPIALSVLGAYSLWVVAILISDIFNSTATFDMLRSMATPIFGAVGLIFVACCVARNPQSLLTYLIVMGVAKSLLGEPLYGDAFSELQTSWTSVQQNTNFFKVRFEPALSPLSVGVAIVLSRRSLLISSLWLVGVGVFYFSLDARSAGLMMFLAGVAMSFIHFGVRFRPKQVIFGAIGGLSIIYGAYVAYVSYLLRSEVLGHSARQLQYAENPYNPISLLLVGRSEWLVMPQAIAERPIFGWGSWAQDEGYRFAYLRQDLLGFADVGLSSRYGDLYIPAHSVLGAAWLWSGILGLVAVVWLARLIWRLVVTTVSNVRSDLLPAICYLAIMLVWHFLFSPPQSVRIHFPIALGVLIAMSRFPLANRLSRSRPGRRHHDIAGLGYGRAKADRRSRSSFLET